jgi:hypothetical protein
MTYEEAERLYKDCDLHRKIARTRQETPWQSAPRQRVQPPRPTQTDGLPPGEELPWWCQPPGMCSPPIAPVVRRDPSAHEILAYYVPEMFQWRRQEQPPTEQLPPLPPPVTTPESEGSPLGPVVNLPPSALPQLRLVADHTIQPGDIVIRNYRIRL